MANMDQFWDISETLLGFVVRTLEVLRIRTPHLFKGSMGSII